MSALISKRNLVMAVLMAAMLISACGSPAPTATATNPPAKATLAPTATPAVTLALPANDTTTDVSFSKDVLPILTNSCVKCHGGQRTNAGLKLNTYDAVMAGSTKGAVVAANDSANSKLYQLTSSGKMPKNGAKLSDADLKIIQAWIDAGAANN